MYRKFTSVIALLIMFLTITSGCISIKFEPQVNSTNNVEIRFETPISPEKATAVNATAQITTDTTVPVKTETVGAIQTETPTLSPSSILLFDNFDNPNTTQGYNTDIWYCDGCDNGSITSENGSVRFELNAQGHVDLASISLFPSDKISYVQAKLNLTKNEGPYSGQDVHLALLTDLTAGTWIAGCWIEPQPPYYQCSVHRLGINDEYYTPSLPVNMAEWHTSKIEIDADTFETSFYFDNKLIGTHKPLDANELKGKYLRTIFGVSSNLASRHIVANIDDVLLVSQVQTTPSSILPASTITPTQVSSKDGMTMIYIPAGDFPMGSDNGWPAEKPIHRVNLDAFWIDQTEVTNAMYILCVKFEGCLIPKNASSDTRVTYYGNPAFDQYPVIYVTWTDAVNYCRWAGRRLPTEAEWEKAARGTDERTYPWGNTSPNSHFANFNNNVMDTSLVGSFPAGISPYGVLDMAGNVEEWVEDWFGPTYYNHSPSKYPTGPTSGSYRMLRGGSWVMNEFYIRAAYRNSLIPDGSGYSVGFRCAMNAP